MDKMLDTETAAKTLGIKRRTLEKWRRLGRGPEFVKLSPKSIRYSADALQQFIAERTMTGETHAE